MYLTLLGYLVGLSCSSASYWQTSEGNCSSANTCDALTFVLPGGKNIKEKNYRIICLFSLLAVCLYNLRKKGTKIHDQIFDGGSTE